MKAFFKKILSFFLSGVITLLPLVITGYIIFFIFKLIEDNIDNILIFIPSHLRNNLIITIIIELAAGIIVFFFFVIIGILMKTVTGKALMSLTDSFFIKMPGLSPIYRAVKQTIDTLTGTKKDFFTRPVLIEYPSPGIWAIGFNTGEATPNINPDINSNKKRYTVFIPTTPNPTTGFLAIVTEDRMKPLNISVEKAIKMILTGGVVKI